MQSENVQLRYDHTYKYLLVAFIASSAVSSPIPGKTAADLPTNALWLNSAGVKIRKTETRN